MRVNELVVHEIRISFHEQLMKLSISYHNKFIHSHNACSKRTIQNGLLEFAFLGLSNWFIVKFIKRGSSRPVCAVYDIYGRDARCLGF